MCTLSTDFATARGDRDAWLAEHIAFFLAWHYRGADPVGAERDVRAALASDPTMTEWAPWPAILAKGVWLRAPQPNNPGGAA